MYISLPVSSFLFQHSCLFIFIRFQLLFSIFFFFNLFLRKNGCLRFSYYPLVFPFLFSLLSSKNLLFFLLSLFFFYTYFSCEHLVNFLPFFPYEFSIKRRLARGWRPCFATVSETSDDMTLVAVSCQIRNS